MNNPADAAAVPAPPPPAPGSPLPIRRLGATGITLPALGIGCWAIGGPDENLGMPMGWSTGANPERSLAGLHTAWEHGARLYDTADIYGHGRSERLLGRLVEHVPRADIVLSSKVGYFTGTSEHGYDPGHMRRQLEQTLENLRTDHLDIYSFHHPDFGTDDHLLRPALDTMRSFRDQGLITAIGLRGPHRFALDRLDTPPDRRGDKIARFRALFATVEPDVLTVRDNLLTPTPSSAGVFHLAEQHDVGILISKPLGQGLLTGSYANRPVPQFGAGDHRLRKRWFRPDALALINTGLERVRALVDDPDDGLVRVALWSCLDRSPNALVLAGFTTPDHVVQNIAALRRRPSPDHIAAARQIMGDVQAALDAAGETVIVGPHRHGADSASSPRRPASVSSDGSRTPSAPRSSIRNDTRDAICRPQPGP